MSDTNKELEDKKLDSDYLTISEASAFMGVSEKSLRNWDTIGRLVPVKTEGGHRRWLKSDLESFKTRNHTTEKFSEPIKLVKIHKVGDPTIGKSHYVISFELNQNPVSEWHRFFGQACRLKNLRGISVNGDKLIVSNTTTESVESQLSLIKEAIAEANNSMNDFRSQLIDHQEKKEQFFKNIDLSL